MANDADINEEMKIWQQGDVILGAELPFLHVFDAHQPITGESRADVASVPAADRNPDLRSVSSEASGFVILTQTCDLVRNCEKRPYVEVAPLTKVGDNTHLLVRESRVPRFVSLTPLADDKLVADLDRVMTVEKAVLATVPKASRIRGCESDAEKQSFAQALARKRSRFAFPNDFVEAVRPIQERVQQKHNKPTEEGRFLRALREIRVKAEPGWSDQGKFLTFYFILPEDEENLDSHRNEADALMARMKISEGQETPESILLSISRMSALLYLSTAQLDFDYLSD